LIPIETIDKVPVAMFSGTVDPTCPHDEAVRGAGIIGADVVDFWSVEGEDHHYWSYASD